MTWLIVLLLVLVSVLLVLLSIKVRKVADLEIENNYLTNENASLMLQVSTLQNNIEKMKSTLQEISEIETKKETKKKQSRKETPASGDVDARLDRLNSDGVQDGKDHS